MKQLFDDVYSYLGRHIVYPNSHSQAAHTLWILGSGFLEYEDIPVFDNYPILAFLSPDEDSGKTRALDVTEQLAHNAINGGSYTAASLCAEIDRQQSTGKLLTMILDELDETFLPGRDNSDYIRLLNNGYQRGKVIVRRNLNGNGNIITNAYCPKAIAGLTATKLKKTTRSRMIIIRMRPMRAGETIARHIDKVTGAALVERTNKWRPIIIDDLRRIDEDSLSDLTKRAAQIWHPLLAIAKLAGDDWFNKAIDAARFFVDKQKPVETLGKQILIELYRAYVSGLHPRGIWGETFASELHDRGFSLEIDKYKVAYYLGENGYGIQTKDLKLGGTNKNGYVWDACMPVFADYLPEELRNQINEENKVGTVGVSRSTGETRPLRYEIPPSYHGF